MKMSSKCAAALLLAVGIAGPVSAQNQCQFGVQSIDNTTIPPTIICNPPPDTGTRSLPEPGTLALLGLGAAGALVARKRRKS